MLISHPVIDNASADFVWGLIEDAQEKGAQALTPIKREGNLLWPVLFDQVNKRYESSMGRAIWSSFTNYSCG